MDEEYLLEKIYDKYQMEISRKDRLENKSIGYYTIVGIFFAAFLVIEPLLFSNGLSITFSAKQILAIINYFFIICYLIAFLFSVIKLHNNYKPKRRPEFSPIDNWDKLTSSSKEEATLLIKNELVKIIGIYEQDNKKFADNLKLINTICIIKVMLILGIFIIYIANLFV